MFKTWQKNEKKQTLANNRHNPSHQSSSRSWSCLDLFGSWSKIGSKHVSSSLPIVRECIQRNMLVAILGFLCVGVTWTCHAWGWLGIATPLPAKMGSNLEASWKLDFLLRARELQPDLKPACLGALGGLNFWTAVRRSGSADAHTRLVWTYFEVAKIRNYVTTTKVVGITTCVKNWFGVSLRELCMGQ